MPNTILQLLAQHRPTATRLLALSLLGALVAGCENLPGPTATDYSTARAERQLASGDFDAAAATWMALAGNAQGAARDRYLLRAADAYLLDGDRRRAGVALDQVTRPPTAPLENDYYLTIAELAAYDGDRGAARAALERADAQRFTLAQRARADGVRGELSFLAGMPADAIATLVRRELWLGSEQEIERNDQTIWEGLLAADPLALQTALESVEDTDVAGWLALGLLADGRNAGGPVRGLAAWERQYPGHPALRFVVPGFAPDALALGAEPRQVALLLPLSGRAATVGRAIRDGAFSAYADRYAGTLDAPRLTVYDTAGETPADVLQRAIDDGAELVIGPVLRSNVDALAAFSVIPVPTVLLNYPTLTETLGRGLFAFGLAPEDEARTAAAQAIADGHRRAVALVPATDWGQRVQGAFAETFTALGGQVLAAENYVTEAADHSDEIERALLLTDSVARYRRMRSLLGTSLQFEPRRRADVDLIFVGANTANARQIKPQLRFHYAGDLPVYATSAVSDPAERDTVNDLNGIRFAEIPWLIDTMEGLATPLTEARRSLSSARNQPRLHALGQDALLVGLGVFSETLQSAPIDGATGRLTLGLDGLVSRELGWAAYVAGRPVGMQRHVPVRRGFDRQDAELSRPVAEARD